MISIEISRNNISPPRHRHWSPALTSNIPPQPRPHPHIPKMDSSNNRLFRFSKPEWLNNSSVRNGGVYVAGALVSIASDPPISTLRTHPKLETSNPQAR